MLVFHPGNLGMMQSDNILQSSLVNTPLGDMLAIADENALYFLEFTEHSNLKCKLERFTLLIKREVVLGHNNTISSIQEELSLYFNGSLKEFKTPIRTLGTQFQKLVWLELTRVLYGSTKGYKEQAKAISKPTASRAVANANGANQMAIIIPCHRIINSNGSIGGYSGGIARKQWLLEHEKSSKLACVYAGY